MTVVDDLSTGRRENLDGALAAGAELVELDIRDGAALARAGRRDAAGGVFHLAAQIDVRKSVADPAFDASINVGGTANVLEAARAAGARRVVFVSTGGAIYGEGEGQELPLAEGAPIAPLLRLRPEQVRRPRATWRSTSGSTASPASRLRLGNVYGPRQDPLGEAGVIAIFCGLLQPAAADRLRRRQADPRLHICGRRGRGGAGRGRVEVTGPINIGTGIETDVLELARASSPPRAIWRSTSASTGCRR